MVYPESSTEIHIFKLKPKVVLLNLLSFGFLGSMLGLLLLYMIGMGISFFKFRAQYGVFSIVLLSVLVPVVVILGLAFLQLLVGALQVFSAQIKITPDGIEHKLWPYRHIRSRWSELERLDKFFFYDMVYLKSYEVIGVSISFTWPLKIFNFSQPSITLSSYTGWPDGPLASDLRRHAPGLFEKRAASPADQGAASDATAQGLGQEDRLLAALSHAAVLISGPGIFIPLIIYATQKDKSSALAFHALQALIYQLVGLVASVIFPVCLFAALIIPILGASQVGQDTTNTVFVAIMVVIGLITLALAFVSLAYTAYGIAAAVMAYQGKDFRYAIIAKQIEKRRNGTK